MAIQGYAAKAVRGIDRRVQGLAHHSPSIRGVVRILAVIVGAMITVVLLPVAGGLGFAALILGEAPLTYSALATVGVMAALLALLLSLKNKVETVLGSITDLSSLTDYVFEQLFEALGEGVVAVGVIAILVGAACGAGARLLGLAWMSPVALTLGAAGVIELILGGSLTIVFKRLVGERLRLKAQAAIRRVKEER